MRTVIQQYLPIDLKKAHRFLSHAGFLLRLLARNKAGDFPLFYKQQPVF
jgi:hypothetical protein